MCVYKKNRDYFLMVFLNFKDSWGWHLLISLTKSEIRKWRGDTNPEWQLGRWQNWIGGVWDLRAVSKGSEKQCMLLCKGISAVSPEWVHPGRRVMGSRWEASISRLLFLKCIWLLGERLYLAQGHPRREVWGEPGEEAGPSPGPVLPVKGITFIAVHLLGARKTRKSVGKVKGFLRPSGKNPPSAGDTGWVPGLGSLACLGARKPLGPEVEPVC